ncbi:MAG: hypothetical protein IIU58_01110, partial [Clostridia bacterium]|nr:hypothetical protein [Clostridia bacterium]
MDHGGKSPLRNRFCDLIISQSEGVVNRKRGGSANSLHTPDPCVLPHKRDKAMLWRSGCTGDDTAGYEKSGRFVQNLLNFRAFCDIIYSIMIRKQEDDIMTESAMQKLRTLA